MTPRCVCWSIFLCLALGLKVKAQVTLDDQGYQNVLISFAQNVPSEKGKELVQSVQDLLRNTSSVLHTAIGIRIASATFLLPPSWSTDTWENVTVTPASTEQTKRRPDISVDATDQSPFGKNPSTLQYGGCGVTGHQITLPLEFVGSTQEYPKGKLLAREWLKYRYGVFEENGFRDDIFYPLFYRIPGGSEIRITECTSEKVAYVFKNPMSDDPCDMNSVGDFDICRAHPDEKSAANVTSSLMYFHKELPDMETICGKDGHSHHITARNKQNALCNGRSIWDVVKSSDDFKTTRKQSSDPDPESIQFSYIQEGEPRFVVLLENSDNLLEKDIPSAIRFALRRFYYDLPAKSKLAIYTYNSDVTEALPYAELSAQGRSDLGTIADFGSEPTNICTSCGLAKAAQILLQSGKVEKGSILLITASPLDKVPELPENLKESGICLNVLKFSSIDNPADQTYDAISNKFHCFSQELLPMTLDTANIFNALSRFLKNYVPEFEIKTVSSGEMSAQIPLTIPRDSTASSYTLWVGRALGRSSIECKAGNAYVKLDRGMTAADIASFTFNPVKDEVTCKLVSAKLPAALVQAQMSTQKGQDFVFDTWIHDLSTEKEQRPILIYAKIYFGGYPVKEANVTVTVSSENDPNENVIMLDSGHGDPDVTKYDGIYSGYFTNFLAAGRYIISVKVNDNEGEAKIGKGIELLTPAACCGSKVVSDDHDVPTFEMERHMVYAAVNKTPEDGYPPSRIHSLIVRIFPLSKIVIMAWTAPGGGKVERYAIKLFLKREDAVTNFDTTGRELNSSSVKKGDIGKPASVIVPYNDLEEDVHYYVAVRSWNEFNKPSEISNVEEFIIPKPGTEEESSSVSTPGSTTGVGDIIPEHPPKKNKTIAIVLGTLGGIAVVCILVYLGYYFFVKKPRRN